MTRMMDNADDIRAALRGTALDGHPVEEGIGGTFLVGDIDPDRILEVWRAARAARTSTGRWPVLTIPGDLHHEPTAQELADLELAARTVDPWSVFRRRPSDTADRDSYDRLLADPVLSSLRRPQFEYLVGTRGWHRMDPVHLVLLPTASQWLAPAWISYFGTSGRPDGTDGLAAALWQWERRWGAELVASWVTMLQFVVGRRPTPGDQAWELAGQLKAVGGNLDMPRPMLALAVAESDAWFLHDRP